MWHDYGSGIEGNPVAHTPRRPRRIKRYLPGKSRTIPAIGGATSHSAIGGGQAKMFFEKKFETKNEY
jgi:hypothetical protein